MLIVVGAIAVLALYLFAPADHVTPFDPVDPERYEASGTTLANGETYVDYEGAVVADETAYFQARSGDGYVRELYEGDGVLYPRLEMDDEARIGDSERVVGEVVSREETDAATPSR